MNDLHNLTERFLIGIRDQNKLVLESLQKGQAADYAQYQNLVGQTTAYAYAFDMMNKEYSKYMESLTGDKPEEDTPDE